MEIFSVKNLSFTYPQMQEKALDNVSFVLSAVSPAAEKQHC